MNQAIIMSKSTEMAEKERIDVLCPVWFMSADKGDTMLDTQPRAEIGDNIAHWGTVGIGIDKIEGTKYAEVLEKDGYYCCSGVVTDGICNGIFSVVLHNKK